MKRRAVLFGLAGCTAGLAGGAAGATFRWHRTPRRTPFLTAEHLRALADQGLPGPRVLFVGNSMILRHDVPALTAAHAAKEGIGLSVATAAADGARLIETIRIPELATVLQPGHWDAVVLQDFTKTPLRRVDRWGSRYAMNWISNRMPQTGIVLYPPWPAIEANTVYRDAGFLTPEPKDPADYRAKTMAFYAGVARKDGFFIAPVPEAWAEASTGGAALYHPDGHHANQQGADLSARVIWSVLKQVL